MSGDRLGIGFVGSGFNARFHIQSFTSVRDADVRGVWSPNEKNAASTAALAREHDVGEARPYKSIRDMVADPAINALWLCGPNQARIANIEEIVDAIKSGAGTLRGLACEKPLARNVAEAKKVSGVANVIVTSMARQGEDLTTANQHIDDGVLTLGPFEIPAIASNASTPNSGQVVITMEGGK